MIAIFLQDIQGYSVTEAAPRLLPWPIAFIITSRLVIRAHGSAGPLVFGTLGLALADLLISFADANTSDEILIGRFALFGVAQAFGAIAIVGAILDSVPRTKVGAAFGTRATVSHISGSLDVAIMGAVLLARARSEMSEITEESGRRLTTEEQQEIDGILAGSEEATAKLDDYPRLGAEQITEAAGQAFTAGMETSMRVAAAAVVLGLPGVRVHDPQGRAPRPGAGLRPRGDPR